MRCRVTRLAATPEMTETVLRCLKCGKACCPCEECRKRAGHTGLCSKCHQSSAVERSTIERGAKQTEAKR
jgi:hypothetical protein